MSKVLKFYCTASASQQSDSHSKNNAAHTWNALAYPVLVLLVNTVLKTLHTQYTCWVCTTIPA